MSGSKHEAAAVLDIRLISPIPGAVVGAKVLVELGGAEDRDPRLRLNGAAAEAERSADGRLFLVSGLIAGDNVIEVSLEESGATLGVRSYPVEGPVFSGPHLKPWTLTTVQAGLGEPLDELGNASSRIAYHYMSATTGAFAPLDPQNPPPSAEIASATTDAGITVPYIVRQELGAINRGIYELAVLCDPARPWSGVSPQRAWNRKLWIYLHGGWNQFWSQSELAGQQAPPPAPAHTALIDMGLRRGFMIARTTQSQSSSNSDTVRAAETLAMLKDHITKAYGPIRYTIGSGASGGSIMQLMIANQYPGIFQGIIPLSSLHSSWYVPGVLFESKLLKYYFATVSPELWQNEDDRLAVDGHRSEATQNFLNTVFDGRIDGRETGGNDPTKGTGLPEGEAYHPERNPAGARGTLQDYQVNYFGKRSESEWIPAERTAGKGYAHLPWDNVGVPYGLCALLAGKISAEQFVDLNEKIGGIDIDNNIVPHRTKAHPIAIARLHRGGFINDFKNVNLVAILDQRPPEQEDLPSHTQFHTWVTREGLVAAHGHADNHVAWTVPGVHTVTTPLEAAFVAMDRWLAAIDADTSDRSLAKKIVANKPAELRDGVTMPGATGSATLPTVTGSIRPSAMPGPWRLAATCECSASLRLSSSRSTAAITRVSHPPTSNGGGCSPLSPRASRTG